MAIQLSPPRDIAIRIVDPVRSSTARHRRRVGSALGVAARGLLSGMAIGLALLGGQSSGVSLATIGAIAIGAALLSWDP